jgi:hypothetical protein
MWWKTLKISPVGSEEGDREHKRGGARAGAPMKVSTALRTLAGAAVLTAASSAAALNLTYGDVAVRNLDSWGFTATNSQLMTDWNGTSGTDQLYQMYGYVGTASGMTAVNSGSFRTGCGTGAASTLCGSAIAATGANSASSTIILNQNVGSGATRLARNALTLTYDFTLVDDTSANDFDRFEWNISFTNNTSSALSFVFYTYLDLDLLGSAGNDLVAVSSSGQAMWISDSGNPTFRPFGWGFQGAVATHYQVSAYPGLQNTLDGWGSAGDLSDTNSLATTPGDATAAFQYAIALAPGQTLTLRSAVAEPATAAMLGAGLAGLALYARPRKRARRAIARRQSEREVPAPSLYERCIDSAPPQAVFLQLVEQCAVADPE